MGTDIAQEFPRLEFKRSKLSYLIAGFVASAAFPVAIVRAVDTILPSVWPVSPSTYFVAWCMMVAGCVLVLTKLLSRMDFEKPLITIDSDAVTLLQFRTKRMLAWSSITKIHFYESGRFRESKTLVFNMADGGKEIFKFTKIAGISARHLFYTIKSYHWKFGPQPGQGSPSYDSSAWTGIDDY